MAVYNVNKIRDWYDDFNSCKSKYLNNYYQAYKSSYIVSNNDSSLCTMQKKLDGYYSKIKNAYSNIGNRWKDFYKDLVNVDAALAGEKTSGSINASGVSSKLNNMPKLKEYKSNINFSNVGVSVGSAVTMGVSVTGATINNNLTISDDVSNAANSAGTTREMIETAAVCASIGTAIAPGVGTILGAAAGAVLSKTGVVSKIKGWFKGAGETIKETAIKVGNTAKELAHDLNHLNEAESAADVLHVLKRAGATVATAGISMVEGVIKLVEDVVDLGALALAATVSVAIGTSDLVNLAASKITGDESLKTNYTKQLWDKTRSFVATDYVGNVFDKFYDNTVLGQEIKNNAYGFDTVRSIGVVVGEVVGTVALTVATGGAYGGITAAAKGAGKVAVKAAIKTTFKKAAKKTVLQGFTYGAVKTAEHTETNWQDSNTSTFKGLVKGTLQGTTDGAFFAIGAKGDAVFRESVQTVGKTALQKAVGLGGKTAFESVVAVGQDVTNIGVNAAFASDSVIDENGKVIKFNNFFDKYNYYYQQAGGFNGLLTSAATASVLSFMSDSSTVLGKAGKAVGTTSTVGATIDTLESNTFRNAIENSAHSNIKALKSATSNSKALANVVDNAIKNVKKANIDFEVVGEHISKKTGEVRKRVMIGGQEHLINKFGKSNIDPNIEIKIPDFTEGTSIKSAKNATKTAKEAAQQTENDIRQAYEQAYGKNFFTGNSAKASAGTAAGTSSFVAIKSKIKNINSKLNNKATVAKYKFINANSTIKYKATNLKQSVKNNASAIKQNITGSAEQIKTKIKNVDINNVKTNVKYKLSNAKNSIKGKATNLKQNLGDKIEQIKINRRTTVEGVDTSLKGRLKQTAKEFNQNARNNASAIKQNITGSAEQIKTKIKNIDVSQTKQNIKDKIANSNGVKKIVSSFDNIKNKTEYANLYRKLNAMAKKTDFDLDYYRKARRSSSQYAKTLELANDVIELRAIEKNLGIESYFKNIDASDTIKKVHLTDMDIETLTARYRELTNKLDAYNGRNISKETFANVETIKNIDDALAKLDAVERKLGYSNGVYVSDKDIMVVSNEQGLAAVKDEQGLSTVKNNGELTGYVTPVTEVIDASIVRDFSTVKNILRKASIATTMTALFGGIIGSNEQDDQEDLRKLNNVRETGTPDKPESVVEKHEATGEPTKTIYDDIKIGSKIGTYNVEYGHDSAAEAVSDTNVETLIKNYVNEKSLFKRFAVVNEDGSVGNISDEQGITLEEFCKKNNITPDKVAVDVASRKGDSLAWISVSELTNSSANDSGVSA